MMMDELEKMQEDMQKLLDFKDGRGAVSPMYTNQDLAGDIQTLARRLRALELTLGEYIIEHN